MSRWTDVLRTGQGQQTLVELRLAYFTYGRTLAKPAGYETFVNLNHFHLYRPNKAYQILFLSNL